jgi:hypothetical protein
MISDRRKQALIEMANRGTPKEQKIAEELIDKYGISVEDETIKQVEFSYRNKYEKQLLLQIWSMVINSAKEGYYTNKSKKNVFIFELTKSQEIELSLFYSIYKREMKEEIEITIHAFIQSNSIFPLSSFENPEDPTDMEKARKILNSAGTIDKINIRKQLR